MMTGSRLRGLYVMRCAIAITTAGSSGRSDQPFKRRRLSSGERGNRSQA